MFKSLFFTLLLLGTLFLTGCPSNSTPAPSPKLDDIIVPAGVTLVSLQCGSIPCAIYWDPDHSQYVLALADGRVVVVKQGG